MPNFHMCCFVILHLNVSHWAQFVWLLLAYCCVDVIVYEIGLVWPLRVLRLRPEYDNCTNRLMMMHIWWNGQGFFGLWWWNEADENCCECGEFWMHLIRMDLLLQSISSFVCAFVCKYNPPVRWCVCYTVLLAHQ